MTQTLQSASNQFLEHLQAIGKAPPTIRSYAIDLDCLAQFAGADIDLQKITPLLLGRFLKSSALLVNRNTGEPRSEITITKTIRVVRQFLNWIWEQGWVSHDPTPKSIQRKRAGSKLAK